MYVSCWMECHDGNIALLVIRVLVLPCDTAERGSKDQDYYRHIQWSPFWALWIIRESNSLIFAIYPSLECRKVAQELSRQEGCHPYKVSSLLWVKLLLGVILFFALRNMTGVFPGLSPPEDVLTSDPHDAVGLKSGNCSIPSVTNAWWTLRYTNSRNLLTLFLLLFPLPSPLLALFLSACLESSS